MYEAPSRSLVGFFGGSSNGMRQHRPAATIATVTALVALAACAPLDSPPIAAFVDSPGDTSLAVDFDASTSGDVDGEIVSFAWSFGDGTTGSGQTIAHVYASAGAYSVTLVVTDDEGHVASVTRVVTVTGPEETPPAGTDVGQLAPDFTLPRLDGGETSLADHRGLVVLLDFWRSTCTPCRQTMPHLENLRAQYASRGLVVVAVNLDESAADAAAYLADNGYDAFVVVRGSLADAKAVRTLYDVEQIPHTFVIDRDGIVRHADHPIRLRDRHIEPWL